MMGIYAIRNLKNGKTYVGSSLYVSTRINQHRSELKRKDHPNSVLQEDWDEFGEESFSFDILEEILDPTDIRNAEQRWLDQLETETTYNIILIACRPPTPRSSLLFDRSGRPTSLFPRCGDRYNSLTVISDDIIKKGRTNFTKCRCDCGTVRDFNTYYLVIKGSPINCGCDKSHTSGRKHGATSGGKVTPEFKAWSHMRSLCMNPMEPRYGDYGGRGISVCKEWESDFSRFLSDMGERPPDKQCLGRKDTSADFNKENCEWTTKERQNNRRRNSVMLSYENRTMTITDWAREIGIDYRTIHARLRNGWNTERALTEGVVVGKNQYSGDLK